MNPAPPASCVVGGPFNLGFKKSGRNGRRIGWPLIMRGREGIDLLDMQKPGTVDLQVAMEPGMTPDELSDILDDLSLTDKRAGEILCVDPRTIRRWLAGPEYASGRAIPEPVAKLLGLMASGRLSVQEVEDA